MVPLLSGVTKISVRSVFSSSLGVTLSNSQTRGSNCKTHQHPEDADKGNGASILVQQQQLY